MEKLGHKKSLQDSEADLIMVLACSVRQSAIDRIYGLKKKFEKIRKNKPLITILSGCVLRSDQPKMEKFFDIVFDIKKLSSLPKLLQGKLTNLQTYKLSNLPTYKLTNYLKIHPSYNSNFQAYVPIMTGCNNFCSYCVVPYVRGREVSRSARGVINEVKGLVSQGYKQITLIGQNVNSYRSTVNRRPLTVINFPALLEVIDEIPGDFWLSFATSHPKDMSDELIKVMARGKHIIPYLHLPIQSGDNQILKKMNRGYTVGHYKKIIRRIRDHIRDISISTDVIVSFPGESKKQFNNSVKLFEEVKFDMAYISQYSVRAGTAAAKLEDNVLKIEKKRRDRILNNVLTKTALEHNKKLIGRIVEVLVDDYKDGFCFGKTSGMKSIKFISEVDYTGQIVPVKIIDCYAWGLSGELPEVVVVLGTTASGKTALAVKLAKKFNGEIISADSRQVYKGMDIGTGKDLAGYKVKGQKSKVKSSSQRSKVAMVPHYLIDVISPKKRFTVADWQKLAYEKIEDILKRGRLPIVCGGTGLYISALVEGYNLQPTRPTRLTGGHGGRATYNLMPIRNRLNKSTLKQLLKKLKKIDPISYQAIDKNNRRRVQRALEIYYQTGKTKSEQLKKQRPPYDFLVLGLTFPRVILRQRIDKRLRQRLEKEGMVDEVKRLHRQGVSWQRLEEFGLEYRFVAFYLQGKVSYQEMLEQLKKAIYDFAKRQMTWFKRDKQIKWFRDYQQAVVLVKKFLAR